ncbi:MAG: electron transport complex subunit E [Candidatus Omnitrophota bacterium]
MNNKQLLNDFIKGLWRQNPVFRMVLGMCPTLAVTNAAVNGFTMGLATTFTLLCSSIIVSSLRKQIPNQVRIPAFVIIIATFVTVVDLFLGSYFPQIRRALGAYLPLIIVNCIILGRQEAFASRNPVTNSIADALGMGLGFTMALVILASVRELIGTGSIFGYPVLGSNYYGLAIMILPPGAFLTLGILISTMNKVVKMIEAKKR